MTPGEERRWLVSLVVKGWWDRLEYHSARHRGGGEAGGTIDVRVLDAPVSGGEQDVVPPGLTCNLHHKDLGIVMSVAREADAVISGRVRS